VVGTSEQNGFSLALGTLVLKMEVHSQFKLIDSCGVGKQGAVVHPSAANWVFAPSLSDQCWCCGHWVR